jgi:hypothetical protein
MVVIGNDREVGADQVSIIDVKDDEDANVGVNTVGANTGYERDASTGYERDASTGYGRDEENGQSLWLIWQPLVDAFAREHDIRLEPPLGPSLAPSGDGDSEVQGMGDLARLDLGPLARWLHLYVANARSGEEEERSVVLVKDYIQQVQSADERLLLLQLALLLRHRRQRCPLPDGPLLVDAQGTGDHNPFLFPDSIDCDGNNNSNVDGDVDMGETELLDLAEHVALEQAVQGRTCQQVEVALQALVGSDPAVIARHAPLLRQLLDLLGGLRSTFNLPTSSSPIRARARITTGPRRRAVHILSPRSRRQLLPTGHAITSSHGRGAERSRMTPGQAHALSRIIGPTRLINQSDLVVVKRQFLQASSSFSSSSAMAPPPPPPSTSTSKSTTAVTRKPLLRKLVLRRPSGS